MSTNAKTNAKTLTAEDGGNIDKVRDILFGGQMRDYERRFIRLEERLLQETSELKDEVRKRLAALEQFVKQEAASLADRIKTEHEERTDATKDLAREQRESAKAFEKKAGAARRLRSARRSANCASSCSSCSSAMSDEVRQKIDDVLARLTQEANELRNDKTDRATLASLLTEMAMRLTNELSIPGIDNRPPRMTTTASDRFRRDPAGARTTAARQRCRSRLDDRDAPRRRTSARCCRRCCCEHAHDPQLARALTPPLEEAITASVKRNPKPLADALFPVMGPAIRKAVSASLAGMVESLNRTLEQALSRRSIRWRLEAMRTGKSFAEVVLLKTLLYRVEQVFLIDRRSGLLLQHVQAGSGVVQDADMVSGMLTAIRDFVQDSFKVGEADSLEALKVGELSVWIEPGPHAIVAAVIRGSAPRDFRPTLQDAVETDPSAVRRAARAIRRRRQHARRRRDRRSKPVCSSSTAPRNASRGRRRAWVLSPPSSRCSC